jgi:predicted transcriptional regulator
MTQMTDESMVLSEQEKQFSDKLERLESKLDSLLALVEKQRRIKDWYTIAEVAVELGRAEFTVREWCRLGQCKAQKTKGYRGGKKQWMISQEVKSRLENEGPSPIGTYRTPSPKY